MKKAKNRRDRRRQEHERLVDACKEAPKPHNASERELWEYLREKDVFVVRGGWPDFCVFDKQGRMLAVEVKPTNMESLDPHQVLVNKTLSDYGIPCFRWSPGSGFIPLNGEVANQRDVPWKTKKRDSIQSSEQTKVCLSCQKRKQIRAFHADWKLRKLGLSPSEGQWTDWCQKCVNAYLKKQTKLAIY